MSTTAVSSHRRFLGRNAKTCRKCGGVEHYVNKLGGISCLLCMPPAKPEHCLFRMTIVGGLWDDAENPFGASDATHAEDFSDSSKSASESHRIASAASGGATVAGESPDASNVVKRDASGSLAPAEVNWFLEPGGIIDQMAVSARRPDLCRDSPLPYPVSRRGETLQEIADRRAGLVKPWKSSRRRSDAGAVTAVLREELQFVVGTDIGPDGHATHRLESFPEGTGCLLFPNRKLPPRDPETPEIEASLKGMTPDDVKTKAVVRLGDRMRIVDIKQVRSV